MSFLRSCFFIVFLCLCTYLVSAQGYKDITLTGPFPEDYKNILNRSVKEVMTREKADRTLQPLYESTDIELKRLFKSGMILYGDTLTTYVRQRGKKLCTYATALSSQPQFFIVRNTSPNAITYADGSIIVTTGLLGRLTSVSQLAFVLAHEISHYEKKHAVKEFQKETYIQKEFKTDMNSDENAYIQAMHYSKENESEADEAGLELMMRAGFNGFEAPRALAKLNPADSTELKPFNLAKVFKSDIFNYDSISKEPPRSGNDDNITIHVSNSSQTTDENDKLETHPALDKRIIALSELLKTTNYKYLQPSDSAAFQPIQTKAKFEMTEDALLSGSYSESLYLSLSLLEQYPDNAYLHYTVARDLFWMSVYEDREKLDDVLDRTYGNYGSRYDSFSAFFKKLTTNDFKKLSYSYIRSKYASEQNNEDVSFYMGFLSEYYLGKGVARFYYNNYLKDFPTGKYIDIVKTKLNS